MELIPDNYFKTYKEYLTINIADALQEIDNIEITPQSFTFYTSVAVISSSRIEGEQMEIDSYVQHKLQNIEYLPELIEKPNDLFKAYLFAKNNSLNKNNFLKCHALLSEHLLPETGRGVYRKNQMLVMDHKSGRIQFEAATFEIIEEEMNKFWNDLAILIESKLDVNEIFYYASLIHLVFVNIHPFNDGNGRSARLLEKWFLAEKLGDKAWYIKSEKYYYHHIDEYYQNLNRLGIFYEKLDYSMSDLFLQMLPHSINYKQ